MACYSPFKIPEKITHNKHIKKKKKTHVMNLEYLIFFSEDNSKFNLTNFLGKWIKNGNPLYLFGNLKPQPSFKIRLGNFFFVCLVFVAFTFLEHWTQKAACYRFCFPVKNNSRLFFVKVRSDKAKDRRTLFLSLLLHLLSHSWKGSMTLYYASVFSSVTRKEVVFISRLRWLDGISGVKEKKITFI